MKSGNSLPRSWLGERRWGSDAPLRVPHSSVSGDALLPDRAGCHPCGATVSAVNEDL